MTKNLKLSFIFYAILCAIVVAFRTLTTFFSGVGLCFATMFIMLVLIFAIFLSDSYVKNRTKDLFILACVFTGLEFFVYFFLEFQIGTIEFWTVMLGFQNFFSFMGILFACYLSFRFIGEFKDVKFGFVEVLLGNRKTNKKTKNAKELSNGSLEDKPNNHSNETDQVEDQPETFEE